MLSTDVPLDKPPHFFSVRTLPILEGRFDYHHSFSAFLRATNQKAHTAHIVGVLAEKLRQKRILFNCDDALKVADMGCADSATCLGYFKRIHHLGGFEYTGIDINDVFLAEADVKLSHNSMCKKHTLLKGDVLLGDLSAISQVAQQRFDLIFVSHLAYYLKSEEYGRLFVDNMLKLLNENGIVIFLHENSTHYFRKTYNRNYKNIDAPALLRGSAQGLLENTEQFNEILFTSTLTFEEMSDELWEVTKQPARYQEYAHIPYFVDNLNKLSFIIQCDLLT